MGILDTIAKKIIGETESKSLGSSSNLDFGAMLSGGRSAHLTAPKLTSSTRADLFMLSADLQGSAGKLALYVGSKGFRLKDIRTDDVVYNQDFTNLDKALNSHQSFMELKEDIFEGVMRDGEVFVEVVKNKAGGLYGFKLLPWSSMQVGVSKYGEVLGYAQTLGGNVKTIFAPEDIIHIMWKRSVKNPSVGRSPIDTLFYDMTTDTGAQVSNNAMFENGGIPANLLILDKEMSKANVELAMEQIKEHYSKPENAHKTGVVQGVSDVKQLSMTARDMEYIVARRFTTEKVCSLTGVPRVLLGYTDDVNYSNHEGQMASFLEMTVNPWQDKIAGLMWAKISRFFSPNLYFEFVRQEADRDEELHSRARQDFLGGILTLNEARAMINYERLDVVNADEPILQGIPVSELGMGLDPLTPNNDGAPS